MKTVLRYLSLPLAICLAAVTGCQNETVKESYYAPNEVVLEDAVLNIADLSVTLGAVFNGDDSGIKEAAFMVYDAASKDTTWFPADKLGDGAASVKLTGLESGHDYYFNFVITTPGANKIKAAEDGYCSLSAPYDFEFSTQTTSTAKILIIKFKGSAALASSMALKLIDSLGNEVLDPPQITVHEGEIKVLFKLDEWPGDLYTASVVVTGADGTSTSSQNANFSTLPLPETLTQLAPAFDGANWTLTASYDGDDKTVTAASVKVFNKAGELLETLVATCSDRKAVATTSGHEYGKYSWTCTLTLVDGSTLEAGPTGFTFAKPREYATLDAPYAALVTAGISTLDEAGPFNFTYSGYDWEVSYLRFKEGKDYLICGSTRQGYLCNVTPFPLGIKTVLMNLTQSDRLITNYEFYAKKGATDEWTLVAAEQPDKKVFKCDLSDGDWKYFMFKSKGVKEVRFSGFSVEYFTEEAIEY